MEWQDLPGGELVQQGLEDLEQGRETVPALLVSIAAPRLRQLGLAVAGTTIEQPEHRLYHLLAAENPDAAHSRYNALIGRLVSFARCAS